MSESKTEASALRPPQGAVSWYSAFFKLLETRQVVKVDKKFLQDQGIASGNERKMVPGLRFLGLIDKDGNSTAEMDSLSVMGEKRRENFEKVVRTAYHTLFEEIKINLEQASAETLVNSFKTDYQMGSLTTARQGAQVFAFLCQKAGILLSKTIIIDLTSNTERKKPGGGGAVKPRAPKGKLPQSEETAPTEQLPEQALGRLTLKDIGYVDIKDGDTLDIAKAYLKILSKKLEIGEGDS